jgi:hypothetical protein
MAGLEERQAEMVWHIFKKDWKLAWVFVLVVSVVHWIDSAIIYKLGLFDEDPMLGMLADAVPMLAFFGSMFLIGAIVHLDSIPGVRQDWLVRPISRWDLVIEKFLFVVLMVNGPIFAEVLLQGLANKFSLRLSLAAAMWQVAFLFFAFTLPLFSFASVTRSMTQAFIFGCSCTFIMVGFQTIASYLNGRAHGTLDRSLGVLLDGWEKQHGSRSVRSPQLSSSAFSILGGGLFSRAAWSFCSALQFLPHNLSRGRRPSPSRRNSRRDPALGPVQLLRLIRSSKNSDPLPDWVLPWNALADSTQQNIRACSCPCRLPVPVPMFFC